MPRRTKIVATLGPAVDTKERVAALLAAGVDVVRVNLSHGDADDHRDRVARLRQAAAEADVEVGLLVDLQGPKIRIGTFREGAVELQAGADFRLDVAADDGEGDAERVCCDYDRLVADVSPGDQLLLDDGRIVLEVTAVRGGGVETRVVVGGRLSGHKGINKLGGGLSAPALTDKDRADMGLAAELEADYLALSFVRSAADVDLARRLFTAAGGTGRLVAKIERAEAVAAAAEIIEAADAIMVARGDLGVEIGDAELPGVQKRLIRLARGADRAVITATQMMQSMVDATLPTRAEVLDVANAVIDGTDAVMLSEETAVGKYPVEAVTAMARICEGAERQREAMIGGYRTDDAFTRVDESIAMAAMYVANRLPVKAIAALTESGDTALWMSRVGSGIPIYAMTPHRQTLRRVTLYRGVYPVAFEAVGNDHAAINEALLKVLVAEGVVDEGDLVIATKGDLSGVHGGTSALKILRVGSPAPRSDR
ncbi:MAG: pyruvate kinase [Gammaproteobacteria bacterium]|nr:pyruvate kinase [Gammaproteobacteria bacterium]